MTGCLHCSAAKLLSCSVTQKILLLSLLTLSSCLGGSASCSAPQLLSTSAQPLSSQLPRILNPHETAPARLLRMVGGQGSQAETSTAPVRQSLLELESSDLIAEEPGIASVTFFSSSTAGPSSSFQNVSSWLRARLRLILEANPWLMGTLTRGKKEKLTHLEHPPKGSPISDQVIDEIFVVETTSSKISREMPYEKLCDAMSKSSMLLPQGKTCINKGIRVLKITIIPEEDGKFALLVCMSHSVADGHTYYKILNMLSREEPIVSLNSVRKHDKGPEMDAAMGQEDHKFMFSVPFFLNYLWRLFLRPKTRTFSYFIDEDKIRSAKLKAKAEGAEFVSTNDIVSSTFASLTSVRLCMMAINFRGKLEGVEDEDAGCYEGALLFDKPAYEDATGIREVLKARHPYCGRKTQLPGIWETIACRMAFVTNWASFAKDIVLEGYQQDLQLPCYEPNSMPYDVAIIYRCNKQRLGILHMTKDYTARDIVEGLPVAEAVSSAIFPDS